MKFSLSEWNFTCLGCASLMPAIQALKCEDGLYCSRECYLILKSSTELLQSLDGRRWRESIAETAPQETPDFTNRWKIESLLSAPLTFARPAAPAPHQNRARKCRPYSKIYISQLGVTRNADMAHVEPSILRQADLDTSLSSDGEALDDLRMAEPQISDMDSYEMQRQSRYEAAKLLILLTGFDLLTEECA